MFKFIYAIKFTEYFVMKRFLLIIGAITCMLALVAVGYMYCKYLPIIWLIAFTPLLAWGIFICIKILVFMYVEAYVDGIMKQAIVSDYKNISNELRRK